MHTAPLLSQHLLQLTVPDGVQPNLGLLLLYLALQLIDLLHQLQLLLILLAELSLHICAILFLIHRHGLESLQLVSKLVPLLADGLQLVGLSLHLLGQVVNMPL